MQLTNKKNRRPARSSANGFSLIELLIVVGIILIIASIAIPNYLRSRMAANETSAVENLRTITTAQTIYNTTYGNGFSPNIAVLGGVLPANCNNAVLIDDVLAIMGVRSGYQFSYAAGAAIAAAPPGCAIPGVNTFTVAATPLAVGSSGQRGFCTDASNVIRYESSGTIGNPGVGGCVDPVWQPIR